MLKVSQDKVWRGFLTPFYLTGSSYVQREDVTGCYVKVSRDKVWRGFLIPFHLTSSSASASHTKRSVGLHHVLFLLWLLSCITHFKALRTKRFRTISSAVGSNCCNYENQFTKIPHRPLELKWHSSKNEGGEDGCTLVVGRRREKDEEGGGTI